MLLGLSVKNLALIEELDMEFAEGFNVLTGETGAGKSVLIGSVNLALGAPADATLIRDGKEYALIELVFRVSDAESVASLREMEVFPEEDGTVVLQRKITPGRSSCKIQGETVTAKQLRAISSLLIQIHGQNDQQSLVSEDEQMRLLDRYIGEDVVRIREQLRMAYDEYRALQTEYEKTDLDEREKQRETDLIRYETAEIEAASLKEGEDVLLEETFRKMEAGRRIKDALSAAVQGLDDDGGALDALSNALRALSSLKNDADAQTFYEQLADAENLVRDLSRDMRGYLDDTSFSEEEYTNTTDRLNLINRLKEKYASLNGSVEDVLRYASDRMERLSQLQDLDAYRSRLAEDVKKAREKTLRYAKQLTACRKKGADAFAPALIEALADFDFNDLRFEVQITSDEAALTGNGMDRVTFLLSTNTGERLRRLSDVASGGELSRIMLGIRCVLAERNDTASMIFDEIDTGISGKTAWSVAKKLGTLSASRQVICITHLAQIAAMQDTHFLIYKEVTGERTYTRIRQLREEDSIAELARLFATSKVSDAAMQNAVETRKEACAFKKREKERS